MNILLAFLLTWSVVGFMVLMVVVSHSNVNRWTGAQTLFITTIAGPLAWIFAVAVGIFGSLGDKK